MVDRAEVGSKMPRAGAMQPRTNEVLELRGLLAPMRAAKPNWELDQGHFAGLRVDYSALRPSGPLMHLAQNDMS